MSFTNLTTIGKLTIDATNFLTMHPALINEIAGDALVHMLNSHARRSRKRRGLSRRKSRKSSNKKRRWFVDNIIMHHKRLHDRNRELVVSNARERAVMRKKELEKKTRPESSLQHQRQKQSQWQEKVNLKKRSLESRSVSQAKKLRAESRWAAVMEIRKTG